MKTNKEYKNTYYVKLKADPVKYAAYLAKCREERKVSYHKNLELSRAHDRKKYQENKEHIIKRKAKSVAKWQSKNKIKLVFSRYVRSAAKRKIEFSLTKEEFDKLLFLECSYCGSTDNIGVDRADNTLGYTTTNSVPCCKVCNYMKSNHALNLFLSHCLAIVKYRDLKE